MTDPVPLNSPDRQPGDPEAPYLSVEMRMLVRVSVGIALLAGLVRLAILGDAAGGLLNLMGWFEMVMAVWVVSPILFAMWRVTRSAYGLVGLIPIATIGNMLAYNIAHDTSSSTAAIGWLFLPAYEWAYLAVSGLGLWVMKRMI